jgi:antitoxin ParD1/3/4
MATMNVSLPDLMKDWVEAKISAGQYSSASDYVRDLIRRDQHYHEKLEALRLALIEGEKSGLSERTIDEIWTDVKARHGLDV